MRRERVSTPLKMLDPVGEGLLIDVRRILAAVLIGSGRAEEHHAGPAFHQFRDEMKSAPLRKVLRCLQRYHDLCLYGVFPSPVARGEISEVDLVAEV